MLETEVELEAVGKNPRAPLRHPEAGVWGLYGVLVVGMLGAVWNSERPSEPLGAEVPAEAFVVPPAGEWSARLVLRGEAPVPVSLKEWRAGYVTRDIEALRRGYRAGWW